MIINLTQHQESLEQRNAGVVPRDPLETARAQELLTFSVRPTRKEVDLRAENLAQLAVSMHAVRTGGDPFAELSCQPLWGIQVMIGGASFLMSALERELRKTGAHVVHSFSRRESQEVAMSDGSVEKVSRFVHDGFVSGGTYV